MPKGKMQHVELPYNKTKISKCLPKAMKWLK